MSNAPGIVRFFLVWLAVYVAGLLLIGVFVGAIYLIYWIFS